MIEKIVTYPWGERPIYYDSFVYKVVDEDINEIQQEFWAKDELEFNVIQNKFNLMRKTIEKLSIEIIEYNPECFECFVDADDDLGMHEIKDKNGKVIKRQHRILTYIQGFLS